MFCSEFVMSARNEATEDLVARARTGDENAVAALLDHLTQTLPQPVKGELRPQDAEQLLTTTRLEAKQRFAEFDGTTEHEAASWFQEILSQQVESARQAAGGSADAFETIAPGKTLKPQEREEFGTRIQEPAQPAKGIHNAPTLAAAADANATIAPDPNATMARAATAPAAVPTKKFGEYEILDTIARGGMGVVYKARQRKLNRVVALKMILAGQFADQSDVDRFYIEAEASANLRHPNIVGVYEVGEAEGQHYFSMDYIDGQSLADLVRENALAPRRAAGYVKTISEAMHYAHQEGILHRDLKPSNVLVDRKNQPLVTDFGLAKRTEGQSQLTMSGTIVGTPAYMPPEQASGKLDLISVRSDVYSLGAILYELLTSRPPFAAANPFETIKQVLEIEPVSPQTLNPNVPADLDTICLKCLQKEPDRRYATAQELVDELQRYLDGAPILARPVGPAERFRRWCRRNPKIAISAGTVALTLVVATIVSTSQWRRAEVARGEAVEAQQEEAKARTAAETAQATAEASIVQMRTAINDLYNIVANDDLLNEPGAKPLRSKLLGKAASLFEQALKRVDDDPGVQADLARSLFSYGGILRELEDSGEAEKKLTWAKDIQTELLNEEPENISRLRDLGNTLNLIGHVLESQEERLDEALEVYEAAIELRQKQVDLDPQNYEFQRKLINSQMNSGLVHKTKFDLRVFSHYDPAQRRLGESQAARDDLLEEISAEAEAKLHLDSAIGSYNLLLLQDLRDQVAWLEDGIAFLQEQPSLDDEQKQQLQRAEKDLANLQASAEGWRERAHKHLDRAFAELDLLMADDADQLPGYKRLSRFQIQHLYAECLLRKGFLAEADDDNETAQQSYDRARGVLESLVHDNPNSHEYRAALAGTHSSIADLRYYLEDDDGALKAINSAIELWNELAPAKPAYAFQLQDAKAFRGEIEQALGKTAGSSNNANGADLEKPEAPQGAPSPSP
jgi:tRNA A-37 threonylcarbamoyl transferase component Bud32